MSASRPCRRPVPLDLDLVIDAPSELVLALLRRGGWDEPLASSFSLAPFRRVVRVRQCGDHPITPLLTRRRGDCSLGQISF